MLKFAVLLNSSVTMIIMIINFAFKIFLAKHFSQFNLVAYYTIIDMFSLLTRVFAGYKDALVTLYFKSEDKTKILQLFTTLFSYVVLFIAFVMIPFVVNFYLVAKIGQLQISWIYISILFLLMNVVAYFGYLLLVQKAYKIISIYDMLKSLLIIISIFLFYIVFKFDASCRTLILATVVANVMLLFYLLWHKGTIFGNTKISEIFTMKMPNFLDDTKKKFIALTFMASSSYFLYGLLLFAPVFVMLHMQELEDLANFQVVARSLYFALVAIFSWPLGRFLLPELSSKLEKRDFDGITVLKKKFIKLLVPFSLLLILGCWFSSKYIIALMFPDIYIDSYKMLNILIVGLPFVMYTNFSSSLIKATGSYKILIMIDIAALFVFTLAFLAFYFLFMLKFASLYAFVFSMIFIFVVTYYHEKKVFLQKGEL